VIITAFNGPGATRKDEMHEGINPGLDAARTTPQDLARRLSKKGVQADVKVLGGL
jgi:hypothetical protein